MSQRFSSGVLLLLAVLAPCVGCQRSPTPQTTPQPSVNPFPPVAEVTSMRALVESIAAPDAEWADVPAEHTQAVVDAFLPAHADPEPVTWEISGWLESEAGGKVTKVMFSVGEPIYYRIDGRYYIGGSGEKLLALIEPSVNTP